MPAEAPASCATSRKPAPAPDRRRAPAGAIAACPHARPPAAGAPPPTRGLSPVHRARRRAAPTATTAPKKPPSAPAPARPPSATRAAESAFPRHRDARPPGPVPAMATERRRSTSPRGVAESPPHAPRLPGGQTDRAWLSGGDPQTGQASLEPARRTTPRQHPPRSGSPAASRPVPPSAGRHAWARRPAAQSAHAIARHRPCRASPLQPAPGLPPAAPGCRSRRRPPGTARAAAAGHQTVRSAAHGTAAPVPPRRPPRPGARPARTARWPRQSAKPAPTGARPA